MALRALVDQEAFLPAVVASEVFCALLIYVTVLRIALQVSAQKLFVNQSELGVELSYSSSCYNAVLLLSDQGRLFHSIELAVHGKKNVCLLGGIY